MNTTIDSVGSEEGLGLVFTEIGHFDQAQHPGVCIAPPANIGTILDPEPHDLSGNPDAPISTDRWDASELSAALPADADAFTSACL